MRLSASILLLVAATAFAQSPTAPPVAVDKQKYRNNDHNPVEWNVLRNGTKDTLVVHIDDAGGIWGNITGTLSDQTDLQSALDTKAPLASPTFTGTVTIPNGGVLGTPASITLTNGTGLPESGVLNLVNDLAALKKTPISAKTADYPVLAGDTSVLFTNTGASTPVIFTLPAAATGLTYTFYVDAAQAVTVTAAGSDTIQFAGSVTAAGGNISAATTGNVVTIVAISATQWVVIYHEGTWTVT